MTQNPTTRPAFIRQPGPALEPRILAAEGQGRSFFFTLEPGIALLEGIRRGFAAEGFTTGTANLRDLALGPLAYVMPALSKTGENAAFYSDIFRPAGITRVHDAAMTFGQRDGAPFFHCHGLWREADGRLSGGHILPEEAIVAEAVTVEAFGIAGAGFEGKPDPETNFTIFHPVPTPGTAPAALEATRRAFAIRLRPNQDFAGALEALCVEHNLHHARIRGGVGSTIGVHLGDGTVFENFATEVYVIDGAITRDTQGAPRASIEIGLIDFTGRMARGRIVNGDNPVLMTFELALEEISDG
jgi:predicted DNA-binding protein with PD1-like motif